MYQRYIKTRDVVIQMGNGKVLLFEETTEKLKEHIKNIEENSSIGSERELADQFGVSRPTIRKAFKVLEEEGLIYKVPNIGFLKSSGREKYVDHELNSFIGFFEDAERQNKQVYSKVIQQTILTGDKRAAEKLQVPEDTEIFVLERLRYVEDKPICLVKTYLVLSRKPDLLNIDFSKVSLYKILQEANIKLSKAKRSIEIKHATNQERYLLNLPPDEPIVWFESLVELEDGTPFEFTISKYPGFDVKFETEVEL